MEAAIDAVKAKPTTTAHSARSAVAEGRWDSGADALPRGIDPHLLSGSVPEGTMGCWIADPPAPVGCDSAAERGGKAREHLAGGRVDPHRRVLVAAALAEVDDGDGDAPSHGPEHEAVP